MSERTTTYFIAILVVTVFIETLVIITMTSEPDSTEALMSSLARTCDRQITAYGDGKVTGAGFAIIDVDKGEASFRCYDWKTEYQPWKN